MPDDSEVLELLPGGVAGRRRLPRPRERSDVVGALFTAHYRDLVRLALLLVDDLPTAEDVVQDAFANLYHRWPFLHDPDKALFYLRAAVANGGRSRLRRRRVARERDTVEVTDASSAENVALGHALEDEVIASLQQLPLRQRQVLVLRYYADLSEAAIADTLGISRGAVKSHASRGIAALSARLGGPR